MTLIADVYYFIIGGNKPAEITIVLKIHKDEIRAGLSLWHYLLIMFIFLRPCNLKNATKIHL